MLFYALIVIPLALTCTMFATRQMMLGFPSGMFWAILGGYAYTQSLVLWDIYYIVFFASMGMLIFTIFAAFALREKIDTIGEMEMEKGDGPDLIDEPETPKATVKQDDFKTRRDLRERARKRRARFSWLPKRGE